MNSFESLKGGKSKMEDNERVFHFSAIWQKEEDRKTACDIPVKEINYRYSDNIHACTCVQCLDKFYKK